MASVQLRRLALGCALAVAGLLALGAGALAADPAIVAATLKPAQVGSGYKLVQRPDGQGVAQVTLDLCGFAFPSEKLRTDRLQVNFIRSASAIGYSHELVLYKPGKAAQALGEVKYAAKNCPTKPFVTPGSNGPAIRFKVTNLADRRLRPGYAALQIQLSATVQGKLQKATVIAVYQVKGNLLSGVYAYPGKGTSDAQLRKGALHAAEAAARNLAPAA